LKRRPSEQKTELRAQCADHLREGRVFILNAMCLVDNDVLPLMFLEGPFLFDDHLVGGHADVEVTWEKPVVPVITEGIEGLWGGGPGGGQGI